MSNHTISGVSQNPVREYKVGDSLQIYDQIREIHRIEDTKIHESTRVAITLKSDRGTEGWTILVRPAGNMLGIIRPQVSRPGTAVLVGQVVYVRQTEDHGGGWAYKHGRSGLGDSDIQNQISKGHARILYTPSAY